MVTMSRFGNYGRLGNQLFQLQFFRMLSKRLNTTFVLPKWQYAQYFKFPPAVGTIEGAIKITEPHYQYDMGPYENLEPGRSYDITGYFQSERYADPLEPIEFTDEFKQQVRDKFYLELARPTIAIGVRRTDYLTGPQVYVNLPVHYFITALMHNFPDWRNYNLVFITDDIPYCKLHFGCLKNALFPETKDIEAMCLVSLCENVIMANSTFYWWGAKLGNPKKVIQPDQLFKGQLLEKYGDINFYSEDWPRVHAVPIDLKNVTFTIPVKCDHRDRMANLKRCVTQLQQYFDTNIIIAEQGGNVMAQDGCEYLCTTYPEFHRTRMLNDMARMATTPFIVNLDCDVVIPPMQWVEAVRLLQAVSDMVYPYDGIFHRVRVKALARFTGDIGVYGADPPDGTPSFGGAVMWNRESFLRLGGENENMISFGPEDVERMERAVKLGLKIDRVGGNLYHFAHHCGPDSSVSNPRFRANRAELEKMRAMSKEQMWEEVKAWPWYSPYTAEYYHEIEDVSQSRDEVFRILGITENDFIIDCGCGLGQWGQGYSKYIGIDYKVPVDKLLFPAQDYIEWDLRIPFLKQDFKADIVLCLEVAEHLEEEYADVLIDNLCSLGDTIVFSAAIPMQGGNGHYNEQWQGYWAEKFNQRGFMWFIYNAIRYNEKIDPYYAQNIVCYKRCSEYKVTPNDDLCVDFVLPRYYEQIVKNLIK